MSETSTYEQTALDASTMEYVVSETSTYEQMATYASSAEQLAPDANAAENLSTAASNSFRANAVKYLASQAFTVVAQNRATAVNYMTLETSYFTAVDRHRRPYCREHGPKPLLQNCWLYKASMQRSWLQREVLWSCRPQRAQFRDNILIFFLSHIAFISYLASEGSRHKPRENGLKENYYKVQNLKGRHFRDNIKFLIIFLSHISFLN